MPKITLQEIQKQLVKLSAHFPEAMMDAETLYALSQDYFEAFPNTESTVFEKAIKHVRENNKFWPKIVDLKEAISLCLEDSTLIEFKMVDRDALPIGKKCSDCGFFGSKCDVSQDNIFCKNSDCGKSRFYERTGPAVDRESISKMVKKIADNAEMPRDTSKDPWLDTRT